MHPERFPKRLLKAGALSSIMALSSIGVGGFMVSTYPDVAAEFSRRLIGDENTAQIESLYLAGRDYLNNIGLETGLIKAKAPYEVSKLTVIPETKELKLAPMVDPIADTSFVQIPEKKRIEPMIIPQISAMFSNPLAGEAQWILGRLPRTSLEDPFMAETFIRPDVQRPTSNLSAVLIDHRRINLNMVGGTQQPGGDRGVRGPGIIPKTDYPDLLLAWNGGFQGIHGNYGMIADGLLYRPIRSGLATIAVTYDGEIEMGEWGKKLTDMNKYQEIRQNAVMLVEDGEVTKAAINQESNNDLWGYISVNTTSFVTNRSAVGLTENNDLIVAVGNNLTARTLAIGMKSLGAKQAMQLDINAQYPRVGIFNLRPDGVLDRGKLTNWMVDPDTFLTSNISRDFMYVTLRSRES